MSKITDALFSKSIKAILAVIFVRPAGTHLRALMNMTGLGSASAQRELAKLTAAGLLVREEIGKVIVYKANKASPIYTELHAIIRKTAGVEQAIKEILLPYQDRIERAFIYGSVASNEDTAASDIDVFVLASKVGSADLYPELVAAEANLGRKISLTIYRPLEYQRKLADKNHFLVSVMNGPKIELIGDHEQERT
jgi:predicted nucleotidyltransferase